MPSRMLTLFGEEIVPEELLGAPKVAAKQPAESSYTTVGILSGWVPDKQYYTIGEVAQLFSIRTSHIRFWTTEFNLKVRTTRKGDRLYTPAVIAELRSIYNLVKERGFTISGAKAALKGGKAAAMESIDLRQALLQLRNQLLTIRNELL